MYRINFCISTRIKLIFSLLFSPIFLVRKHFPKLCMQFIREVPKISEVKMKNKRNKDAKRRLETRDGQAIISKVLLLRFSFFGTVKTTIRFPKVFTAKLQFLFGREFGMMYRQDLHKDVLFIDAAIYLVILSSSVWSFLLIFAIEHVGTSIALLCIYESRSCRSFSDWCDFSDLTEEPGDDFSLQVIPIVCLVILASRMIW